MPRRTQWLIPHAISPPRDGTDRKGQACTVFDLVVHTVTVQIALENRTFRVRLPCLADNVYERGDSTFVAVLAVQRQAQVLFTSRSQTNCLQRQWSWQRTSSALGTRRLGQGMLLRIPCIWQADLRAGVACEAGLPSEARIGLEPGSPWASL